jgi:acyl transferase domain-containing protein/NADPH:quinone reductase-like Zn-dependent oxidoreductase/aryl carrier-like protein
MDIAIVGLSLRLPNDINNLEDLYNRLKNKIDCITEHPDDRFHKESYYDEENSIGKMNTKRAGYLNDVYDFDNSFFKVSNKEARTTDPQQRIMLELVYEALQNGHISLDECKNTNTGVFVGCCNTEYFSKQTENGEFCNDYSLPGGLLTLLSNRISYFYDFKGPSMTVDTACSSSGHALHLACQSLIHGETDMCIVGGSNLLLNPETTVGFSQGKFLAPDGKCKSFDEAANGYVRAEGCVVFILEPLEQAIKKNRHIYAVVQNTAINQDGKTNSITMPNGDLQMELLQKIYTGIDLDEITYIEAHGTGTKVGDKIETNSIGSVLGQCRTTGPLPIGSVKSVLGHTEATSGLAALCKIILMMEKRELLPNQHFQTPSSNIDWTTLNLKVVTECIPIETDRILMGVNNYGFGGSNFHCLLENYIVPEDEIEIDHEVEEEGLGLHLLCVTGADEEAIDKNVMPYILHENSDFLKYVYNQNCSTDLFEEAKMYIVENQQDFQSQILNPDKVKDLSVVYGKRNVLGEPNICFVFCGQGPQFLDMGRDYVKRFPVFRDKILECDNHWKRISGYSFLEEYGLFTENAQADVPISDPIVAQPAIAFFQIALFHLYESFGIVPNTVIGHSAGEQAAFYASGALTLEDTIKISYYRSIYQQQTAGLGNMLVINQNIETIDTLLEANPALELAVVNSNTSYVFSGPTEGIDLLKKQLTEDGISAIKIAGRCPFHSSLQESIKEKILTSTRNIVCHEPKIELISTVTGYSFQKEDYTPDYWWNNIRNVVRFYEGIEQSDADVFIEIAPHIVLTSNIQIVHKEALVLHSAHRKEDSARRFLSTLAKLYLCGAPVDMSLFGIENTTHYPLYQWNKKRHYQEPTISSNRRMNIVPKVNTIVFSPNKYPYVKDHIIGEKAILPTVTYLDLIRTYVIDKDDENQIQDLTIHTMYDITTEDIEFTVLRDDKGGYSFVSPDKKTKYISFKLKSVDGQIVAPITDVKTLLTSPNQLTRGELKEIITNKNFNFGEKMIGYQKAYLGGMKNDILIEISPRVRTDIIHPIVFDASVISNLMLPLQGITSYYQYLPSNIESITYKSNGVAKYVYTNGTLDTRKIQKYDSFILDENLNVLVHLAGITSVNVSNMNTQIYRIEQKICALEEEPLSAIMPIEKLKGESLLDIRDILFENKAVIYLIDISDDYEIVGFIRSLINEIKEVKFKICYHQNDVPLSLNQAWPNIEYFYHSGKFTEAKLVLATPSVNGLNLDYYLNYTNKGSLQNLKFVSALRKPLKSNEVRVKVHTAALNFKDIAVMFDLVKDSALGYEFSGTVEESKSPNFHIGDRVFGTNTETGNCIGNSVVSQDCYLWTTPVEFTDTEAASFSLSYGTAYLALCEFGKISSEDVVLIHSATGALGLAAIEMCKTVGCKVIATAGNEDKRAYLRQLPNVLYVSDSRSNETYQKDIISFTKGQGVDVILASTIGEAMSTNLTLLKPGGRYLDVGKKLIYEKGSLPLEHFLKSIQYHSVHFDELLRTKNAYIRTVVERVMELFRLKVVNLFPLIRSDISEVRQTFTEFSKSNHIGKYVCGVNGFEPQSSECLLPVNIFNPNAYYLITGGLGGLGVVLMEWMRQQGARKFLVTSRTMPTLSQDKDVIIIQTDLLDYEALNVELARYDIDGVFHLAGMIKDKMANGLTMGDIPEIMDVKKQGIENLGRIFLSRQHTYFVAFSSIVALIGNPGQSIYAAANSYMDEYCQRRKLKGLPALSLNLGAIGGCGMIGKNFKLGKTMMDNGFNFTVYHDLFVQMKKVLLDKTIVQACITDQDWNNLQGLNTAPIFSPFLRQNDTTDIVDSAVEAEMVEKKLLVFLYGLLDVKEIDKQKNLIAYGVDSIMSMEIANWCRDQLGIAIKQIDILQGITTMEILKKNKHGQVAQEDKTESPTPGKFVFQARRTRWIDSLKLESNVGNAGSSILLYGFGLLGLGLSYYYCLV